MKIQEYKDKDLYEIDNIPINIIDIRAIVRNYLIHYGYQRTLESFDKYSSENKNLYLNNNFNTNDFVSKTLLLRNGNYIYIFN